MASYFKSVSQEFYKLLDSFYTYGNEVEFTQGMKNTFEEAMQVIAAELRSRGIFSRQIGYELSEAPKPFYEAFYTTSRRFMKDHIINLVKKSYNLKGRCLVDFYIQIWKDFRKTSISLVKLLSPIHIKFTQLDPECPNLYLSVLSLNSWELYAEKLTGRVTEEVMMIINENRKNKDLTTTCPAHVYMSELIEMSLTVYGFYSCEMSNRDLFFPSNLHPVDGIYHRYTCSFYETESLRLLKNNSLVSYLVITDDILRKEIRQCIYVYKMSRVFVLFTIKSLYLRFIHNHRRLLTKLFTESISNNEVTVLRQFSSTLDSFFISDLVILFAKSLHSYIISHERNNIRKLVEEGNIHPKLYVDTIIEMKRKYTSLAENAFRNKKEFMAVVDKALHELMNYNVFTETNGTQESARFLAKYSDSVLRNPQAHIIDDLDWLIKYLKDKDVFEETFIQLSKIRLINKESINTELEQRVIAMIESSRIEKSERLIAFKSMLMDIIVSSDLSTEFENILIFTEHRHVEFSAKILKGSIWQLAEQNHQLVIPKTLSVDTDTFFNIYKMRFPKRKLTWLDHMTKVELVSNCFKLRYTFLLNIYQATVLTEFNKAVSWSMEELQQLTKFDPQCLNAVIQSLAKAKVVRLIETTTNLENKMIVMLNCNYKNKRPYVILNNRMEASKTKDHVMSEASKNHAIQAAIARIAKKRLTVIHDDLVSQIIEQLESKFDVSLNAIKENIEKLIAEQLINRNIDKNDLYVYNP